MNLTDFLANLALWVFGPVLSVIITGLLFDRFVIRRVMKNKDIQDLIRLFREGKERLEKLIEQNGKE